MTNDLIVIEDCSPYFIRIKFDQLEKIISLIDQINKNGALCAIFCKSLIIK